MVGNKGMAKDYREPGKFVEPAKPTPGDRLNHFRVCGADKKWHAAEAKIVGDTVVVGSEKVSVPIGVQYAYSGVPENSNLYNKAGLPATPFAMINGEFILKKTIWRKRLSKRRGMLATPIPITLVVQASHDLSRTVKNILIGDVWYLTGSTQLTSEWAFNQRDKEAKLPATMPLVREFKRKTNASTSATPRKRRFETGGGKYRSSWLTADYSKEGSGVTMFAYEFAKTLDRPGIPQGFVTMSSGQGGRNRQIASPLSWTSFQGVKEIKSPVFEARLNELFLQFPNTGVAKQAVAGHILAVQGFVKGVIDGRGGDFSKLALQAPAFPEAGRGGTVASDTIPTYAYNWGVSPLTPMGVSGVIWVPSENNIGENPAHYAAELEIYEKSLPATYGQKKVQFLYAQPSARLVEGITAPKILGAKSIPIDPWPKSLKELAITLAKLVN
ncbi:MAG: hypothetical protein OSA93_08545 [Akkermansiaceae bacterium]|jgi:hypothetical protein|nr:hypothetical protein [Akkermansiaceae bacterium]